MSAAHLQRKLDHVVKLINELSLLARQEYGPEAHVFMEAGGCMNIMAGDCDGPGHERQKFVRHHSTKVCDLGIGAW